MKRTLINLWAIAALIGFSALAVFLALGWSHGFGSRSRPSDLESSVAMELHDSSIPSRYDKMRNPLSLTPNSLIDAGVSYENHCAVCHGDDGRGITKFDGIMAPRPTDLLSDDTQQMSDGALYYTIENGIRWTGMPAFGARGDGDKNIWQIVAFLRQLPRLNPQERQQIVARSRESMNRSSN